MGKPGAIKYNNGASSAQKQHTNQVFAMLTSKFIKEYKGKGGYERALTMIDKNNPEGASPRTDSPLSGALTPSGNDSVDNDLGTTKKRRKNSLLGQSPTLGSKSTLG